MDYKDIAGKSMPDLEKSLAEAREALRNFRFNTAGGKIKNVKEGRVIKKNIARLETAKTVLRANVAK